MARPLRFKPLVVAGGGNERPPRPRRLLGEALVQSGVLAQEALEGALARQQEQDAPLGRILLAEAAVSAEALTVALAAQAELPLVDLVAMPPDAALVADLDPYRCLALEAMPWRQVGRTRIIAVTSPSAIDDAVAQTPATLGGTAWLLSRWCEQGTPV